MSNLPAKIISQIEAAEMDCETTVEIRIETNEHMEDVGKLLRTLKTRAKELDEARKEITKPIDEQKAAVMAEFKPIMERLSKAEAAIKAAIVDYENRIKEENERLQKIAEAEAQKEADAKKIAAIADAEQAIEEGKHELAETYLNKAEAIVPKVMDIAKERRPTGIAMVTRWIAEVVDIEKVPREFLMVDDKRLQRYASAMKENAKADGIVFKEVQSVSAKSY